MGPPIQHVGSTWRPGIRHNIPWILLASLGGFVICCVAMFAVLWTSEGKDILTWPTHSRSVSPSVLLSVGSGLANLCLAVALGKAYETAWWLQALDGARLGRLHFDLDVQHRLMALWSRNARLNKFAIAAVVALLVSLADGPLIQKSSWTTTKVLPPLTTPMNVPVSKALLPANFSSYAGAGTGPDLFTPLFANISRQYTNREAMTISLDGCKTNTTCALTLPGSGFDVSCTERDVPFDFDQLASASRHNNITIYNVTVTFGGDVADVSSFSMINVTVLYKPNSLCHGSLVSRTCTLRLATVQYPLRITNGTAKLERWNLGSNDTIEIAKFPASGLGRGVLFTGSQAAGGFETMLGGIAKVLDGLYTSTVTLRLAVMTAVPFLLYSEGQSPSAYLASPSSSYGNCTMTWVDPTVDLINTARELMFRSILAQSLANPAGAASQSLPVQVTRAAGVYEVSYWYMVAAVACMLLQVCLILYLMAGWYRLGRAMSLDAFEIARAFGAPIMQAGSSNVPIEDTVALREQSAVRYGEVVQGNGEVGVTQHNVQHGQYRNVITEGLIEIQATKLYDREHGRHEMLPRLGFEVAEHARDIRHGVMY